MANPTTTSSSAYASSAPPRPSPSTTSIDDYLSLLTAQHDEGIALVDSVQRTVDANADVVVRVDCILYVYMRGEDGVIRRMPLTAAASGAAVTADVVPTETARMHLAGQLPSVDKAVTAIVQQPHTRAAREMLASWSVPADCVVTAVEDIFNDRLKYEFKTLPDAARLVRGMLPLAKKYGLLREAPALKGLHVFWVNYDSILRALRSLATLLRGVGPTVDLIAAGECVSTVNGMMASLVDVGVRMLPREALLDPRLKSLIDSGVPPAIATSAVSLLSSHLTSRGLAASTGFKLLYSGARDGMTSTAYHSRVDGQPRLLTLICGDGYWFGAYTNAAPSPPHGEWTFDSNACLMTISNPHGIAPTVYPVKADQAKHAMYTYTDCGPCFGASGNDLFVSGPAFESSTGCRFPRSYSDSTGKGKLTFTGKERGWRVTNIIVVQV